MTRNRTVALGLAAVLLVAGGAGLWEWLNRCTIDEQRVATVGDAGAEAMGAQGKKTPKAAAPGAAVIIDGGFRGPPVGNGVVVASFGWGSGAGNLGRSVPDEANPEAPMSLTLDATGTAWILDQVNGRLVKVDRNGQPAGEVPLPVQAAQDVVVTADGKALVMDRLVDKAVAVLGPDGKPLGELPIVGKGLEEGGASTGLFTSGDDVYVEREHGDSVRIGSTSGKADPERPEIPGRPGQDDASYLTANIVEPRDGTVMVTAIEKANLAHRFTRLYALGSPVVMLNLLDADRRGTIYLAATVERPTSTPERPDFAVGLLCLDGLDGRPVGQAVLPANTMPEETFREFAVLPEGGVMALERTPEGPRLVRYACQ